MWQKAKKKRKEKRPSRNKTKLKTENRKRKRKSITKCLERNYSFRIELANKLDLRQVSLSRTCWRGTRSSLALHQLMMLLDIPTIQLCLQLRQWLCRDSLGQSIAVNCGRFSSISSMGMTQAKTQTQTKTDRGSLSIKGLCFEKIQL